ncbi:hypothetical protein GGI07_003036 [Coemansia sp. Benny D115]|nr:hypothetical protein GGI07_003036 [Coemansia sp. Benny D115]
MYKYRVSVPGLGTGASDDIKELRIQDKNFTQLVETVFDNWEPRHNHTGYTVSKQDPRTIWLDVCCPAKTDVDALSSIFGIDPSTVNRLNDGIAGKGVDSECRSVDTSLYLCWAETTASKRSAAQYFTYGTVDQHATAAGGARASSTADELSAGTTAVGDQTNVTESSWMGGYFPVPPWLQPSATQVLSRLDLRKRPRKNKAGEPIANQAGIDAARRQHMKQLLQMFSKPTVVNKERTVAVLRRWGPTYDTWHKEVINSDHSRPPSSQVSKKIVEQLSREARHLIGYQPVQVWIQGPVVLTFHMAGSNAIDRVMLEMEGSEAHMASVDPLAIVAGLVGHWIQAAHRCLDVVEAYADRLDDDLTSPVVSRSAEAASWTPVIARCRKTALALLRRCQVDEALLGQLSSAAVHLQPTTLTIKSTATEPPPLPFGRQMTMQDIAAHLPGQRAGVLRQQRTLAANLRDEYKKAERRFSRLHTMLLDRQRLRLLSTQKHIHQYFRILVTVELVFLPIELWYNLDNLNGITTPGHLQPDLNSDTDFWYTVMGILVWAAMAILLYAIYIKFFERKPEPLTFEKIAGLRGGSGSGSGWDRLGRTGPLLQSRFSGVSEQAEKSDFDTGSVGKDR